MPNTYTQVYIHGVFAVNNRHHLIEKEHRFELARYTNGILAAHDHIPVAAYFMPDHAHVLFGLNPNESISNIIRDVKANTSRFMNQISRGIEPFAWQSGYGAFCCPRRDLDIVAAYVNNQEIHHQKHSFREEYLRILHENEVKYDSTYLFDWNE